jgi:hypothetical protein
LPLASFQSSQLFRILSIYSMLIFCHGLSWAVCCNSPFQCLLCSSLDLALTFSTLTSSQSLACLDHLSLALSWTWPPLALGPSAALLSPHSTKPFFCWPSPPLWGQERVMKDIWRGGVCSRQM